MGNIDKNRVEALLRRDSIQGMLDMYLYTRENMFVEGSANDEIDEIIRVLEYLKVELNDVCEGFDQEDYDRYNKVKEMIDNVVISV